MNSDLLKMLPINYIYLIYDKSQIIYIWYMILYKQDLALNNLQGLIWNKTQPTKLNGYVSSSRLVFLIVKTDLTIKH